MSTGSVTEGGSRPEPAVLPAVPADQASLRSRLFRPGWPLLWLYLGFPAWWLLGVSHLIFLLLAAPMALDLLRRAHVRVPRGFGLMVLFLFWVAAGIVVLWFDVAGTVPEAGPAKLIPFVYRAGWYLATAIVLLYVLNLPEDDLPSRRISELLGLMFVLTALGGLVGIVASNVEFPSLFQLLVPQGSQTSFIESLIAPRLSATQDFLGYDVARPTAPFSYANSWGNNLALFLPFFVLTWLRRDAGWRRVAAVPILAGAAVGVVFSLNRGVWLGLGLMAAYLLIRLAFTGQRRAVAALVAALTAVVLVVVVTPLGSTLTDRLNTPHSNERRESVAGAVVAKTWEESPVLGFGSTRTVAGNFSSVAGGATPECRQCAAPPLGTQGFMWRLVFTTGFVGAGLFLAFLVVQFVTHLRMTGTYAIVGTGLIAVSLVFFTVYDSLESPLYTLFIAIGLMGREAMQRA